MADADFNAELAMNVLSQMLRAIDAAMLSTRTTEGEHQRSETTLNIATHMGIR